LERWYLLMHRSVYFSPCLAISPGLSIKNIEIINADRAVGNFTESICNVIMSMSPIRIIEALFVGMNTLALLVAA